MDGLAEKPCDPPCCPLTADWLRIVITIRKVERDVYNNWVKSGNDFIMYLDNT